jgi:outer membrane usher protein
MMAVLSFLAAAPRAARAAAAPLASEHVASPLHGARDLLLDVIVNGRSIGMLGEFREQHGDLYATRKELESLGFRVAPEALAAGPDTLVALAKLPGISYKVDETSQTITFVSTAAALKPTELGPQESPVSSLPVKSAIGAVANYDITGLYADHRFVGDMLFDARIFSPWGVAESSFTATNARSLQAAPVVRLDTAITASDTAALRQYQMGDLISGGLDWSRPVRLGGIQISTNFGIRPDLLTFPVPTITGQVAVPSSVDVLVNGVQELSQPVPPGPFEIRQLPIVTGLGDVSIVVHNAAGQQTTQTLQLYSSRQLVAPGLDDISAEIGMVRLNYGTRSNDYRAPAGSVSYRRGVTKWLTFQGHAEGIFGGGSYLGAKIASGGMAGGGAVLALGGLGVVSADLAGSVFGRRNGGLASVGFERIAQHVSLSLSLQATARAFGDIAADYGDPVPSLQARAVLGLSWPRFGSLGIAFTEQRRPATQAQAQASQSTLAAAQAAERDGFGFVPLALASKTRLFSVSYSRPLFGQRAFVSATAFHDLANRGSSGATVALTIPLGRRSSVSFEGDGNQAGADGVIEATQAAGDIGDTGYQLREAAGEGARQLAIGTYRSPWGVVDAGIDHLGASTSLRADIQGAVAFAGGSVFPSLPINDSFAVVDTGGTPGVHVFQENRLVGSTNAAGKLLVTDLRAFDANRLGVDPADIPIDADAGPTTQMVRPGDRSGVVVHFKMQPSHGAVVVLHDEAGRAVQLGSRARLVTQKDVPELVIGYDGEVFATGLQPHNRIVVVQPNGVRCVADFDYTPVPGQIPRIGPRVCHTAPP